MRRLLFCPEDRMMRRLLSALCVALTLIPATVSAQGTPMPFVRPYFTNNSGGVCANCRLYTYAAGTTTTQPTYTTVTLTVGTENANPIVLDSSGRPSSGYIYLSQTSYRFVLKNSTSTVTYWDSDNTPAIPSSTGGVDVIATAGETLAAGDVTYLSDGSGAKNSGRWYKADADFVYSSSTATMVGIATTAISSGATGTVRLAGRVTGLSGLLSGSDYYVSATAGSLTATAPTIARFVGRADSSTTIDMFGGPLFPLPSTAAGQLLQSGGAGVGPSWGSSSTAVGQVLQSTGASVAPAWGAPVTRLSKAATYSLTAADCKGDCVVLADATSGAITVNLPTAVGETLRVRVMKTDASANAVTVDGAGTETINGALTSVLIERYDTVSLSSDNANWQSVPVYSNMPRARAFNSAAQVLAVSTPAVITLNSETWDVGAMHSTSANTERVTIPTGGDGTYTVKFVSIFRQAGGAFDGVLTCSFRKNGTITRSFPQTNALDTDNGIYFADELTLVAADYVEVYCDPGGRQFTIGSAATATESLFLVERIR